METFGAGLTTVLGVRVRVGRRYLMGLGMVADEYTGTEGTVDEVQGDDHIMVELDSGRAVWFCAGRLEVL